MASSSSAKKVARVAARSGSGSQSSAGKAAKQRNWLFGVAIVAIVGLGVGAVAFARSENIGLGENDTQPRARVKEGEPFDHWHASFALNVCGEEKPVIQEVPGDPQGIHTHGDGLIHIHPFTVRAAGKRATLSKFFGQAKLEVTDDGFTDQAGDSYRAGKASDEGVTNCGGEDTEVVLVHWKDAATAAGREPDEIYTEDFGSIRFTEDLGAYTLALVPKGDTSGVPAPSASAQIATLGAQDNDAAATEAPAEDDTEVTTSSVVVDGEPEADASTTAPATDATTTAPAEEPTTTVAAG